ncbi:MAG: phosphatidate cytidylyltransferase [Parabacteroides sp.]|nr:phosphatidate cytidylyltransferase [Parabacteroides sp.]
MALKNLLIRTVTGIIFVGVMVSAICYSSFSFLLLFGLVTGLTVWEFSGLLKNYEESSMQRMVNVIEGVYLFTASFLYANNYVDSKIFLPYLLLLMLSMIGELFFKAPNPINNFAFSFLTQVYCAGSFSLLNFIGTAPDGNTYSPLLVLALFIFIWVNDTGAYVVGSMIGRNKMFERISPKKSWEGFFGGLIFVLAASLLFVWYEPVINCYKWLGLAATITIFGTLGDLIESLIKRTLKIKDSGNILPGHGGMLDRFDSIIMAIPASYIYIRLFIQS